MTMPCNCKLEFKYHLLSELGDIDIACLKLRKFLSEAKLENLIFETELLAREALVNAVVHGNALDKEKRVNFKVIIKDKELVIEIQDQGQGFDWERQSKKRSDLSDDSGRGLLIFDNYATQVKYNEKGNKVTLRKSIE